ncbi:MAG: mannose-1-phosphate guanylyltransferase, partial [Candidatus Omnitrophica bacterium]|nr:mannose-1-phosphate guanylyltransferase [Candidatus Omnitrophota bacterium]
MNYVIILAGGVGSRFWPLSRETEPKQFLPIGSRRPMLEDAVLRLAAVTDRKRIFIATGLRHRLKVKQCTRGLGLKDKNYLFEPRVKNTLAPIALLSRRIFDADPEAVIAVVPCDHFVADVRVFRRTVKKAFSVAREGKIVTFGFPPRRPETGYGYIKVKGPRRRTGYFSVDRFLEKPSLARAKTYLAGRGYYWNGGVFVFPAQLMCEEVKRHCPPVYDLVGKMDTPAGFNRLWPRLPSISIDYAVMEKSRSLVVL